VFNIWAIIYLKLLFADWKRSLILYSCPYTIPKEILFSQRINRQFIIIIKNQIKFIDKLLFDDIELSGDISCKNIIKKNHNKYLVIYFLELSREYFIASEVCNLMFFDLTNNIIPNINNGTDIKAKIDNNKLTVLLIASKNDWSNQDLDKGKNIKLAISRKTKTNIGEITKQIQVFFIIQEYNNKIIK